MNEWSLVWDLDVTDDSLYSPGTYTFKFVVTIGLQPTPQDYTVTLILNDPCDSTIISVDAILDFSITNDGSVTSETLAVTDSYSAA